MISVVSVLVPHQTWSLEGPAGPVQRDGLVQFWLHAPSDQLEALWKSGFGTVIVSVKNHLQFVSPLNRWNNVMPLRKVAQGGLDQPLSSIDVG